MWTHFKNIHYRIHSCCE